MSVDIDIITPTGMEITAELQSRGITCRHIT